MEKTSQNTIALIHKHGLKILKACQGLTKKLAEIRWVSTTVMQGERASQQMIFLHSKKTALA